MWLGLGIRITNWWRTLAANGPFNNHATLTDGLVSVWPLSEDGFDVHGGNDLTNNNGVTFVAKGVGAPANMPDTAANFAAASNQFFSLAGGVSGFSGATFSYALWTQHAAHALREILWCGGAAGRPALQLETDGDLTVFASSTQYQNSSATNVLPAGQWNLLIVVFDGGEANEDDRFKLYINGTQITISTAGSGPDIPTTVVLGDPFELGRYGGGGFQWSGQMSGLMNWSRVLTSAECTDLWAAGDGLFY